MTGESTIFAAQFADMFNKFVKQQLDFQKNLEKTLGKIANNTSTADKSTRQNSNFQNYQGELGKFNAKEKREQSSKKNPREIIEKPTPVTLVGISKKAAEALKDEDTYNITNQTSGGKGSGSGLLGMLGSLLGPILPSLLKFIGIPAIGAALGRFFNLKPFLSALGLTGAIPKITSMLSQGVGKLFTKVKLGEKVTKFFSAIKGFKFLQPFLKPLKALFNPILKGGAKVGGWLFRKLPGIGFLLSLGIGMDKIVNQKGKTLEGLLDIAAGFSYMFPGVGTVIGLGIDALNWLINSEAMGDDAKADYANLKQTPIGFKSFGDIFREGMYDIKQGQQNVKSYFGKVGLQYGKFQKDPSLTNFIPFVEGLFGSYDPFVMGLKFLNGDEVFPSIDEAQGGMSWTILKETLLLPFYNLTKNLFGKVSDLLAEEFGLFITAVEDDVNAKKTDAELNEKYKKRSAELKETILNEFPESNPMDYKAWALKTGKYYHGGKMGKRIRDNYYQSYQSYLESLREDLYQQQEEELTPQSEENTDLNIEPIYEDSNYIPYPFVAPEGTERITDPLTGESNSISPDHPLLKLRNDFSQLLEATNEQNKMMAAMLQQNTSNNILAPSTTNNNYFTVSSNVKDYRSGLYS